jgi:hypothetical protein
LEAVPGRAATVVTLVRATAFFCFLAVAAAAVGTVSATDAIKAATTTVTFMGRPREEFWNGFDI